MRKTEASAEDLKKAAEETLTSAQKIGEILSKQQTESPAAQGPASQDNGQKANGEEEKGKKEDKGKAEEGEVVE